MKQQLSIKIAHLIAHLNFWNYFSFWSSWKKENFEQTAAKKTYKINSVKMSAIRIHIHTKRSSFSGCDCLAGLTCSGVDIKWFELGRFLTAIKGFIILMIPEMKKTTAVPAKKYSTSTHERYFQNTIQNRTIQVQSLASEKGPKTPKTRNWVCIFFGRYRLKNPPNGACFLRNH